MRLTAVMQSGIFALSVANLMLCGVVYALCGVDLKLFRSSEEVTKMLMVEVMQFPRSLDVARWN
jgi:hypothetical protein